MPRGRRPGSHQQIKCGICLHPERGRIDFLVCSGAGVQPTAKKFGVSYDSLRNHVAKHISQSYRDAVRSGPLQSEEQLRRLVAESGAGVIENLKAIYSGLASRWLHAFEAGDDHKLSLVTGKLHVNLEMQARITKELSPGGSVHIQNNYLAPSSGISASCTSAGRMQGAGRVDPVGAQGLGSRPRTRRRLCSGTAAEVRL